jgi:hypothetical protein
VFLFGGKRKKKEGRFRIIYSFTRHMKEKKRRMADSLWYNRWNE